MDQTRGHGHFRGCQRVSAGSLALWLKSAGEQTPPDAARTVT